MCRVDRGGTAIYKAIDSLKVSTFPVMQFKTDSMGGYVAENHRAHMQLAPWTFRWINQDKDKKKKSWVEKLDMNKIY